MREWGLLKAKEDLPLHAIARSTVKGVFDQPDNFHIEFGVGTAPKSNVAPNGALVPKEMPGELSIDNDDIGVLLHVSVVTRIHSIELIEIAPFEKRYSH